MFIYVNAFIDNREKQKGSLGGNKMTTKKQLIEKIKKEVKFYAIPRAMNTRSKDELLNLYNEAKRLGLLKPKCICCSTTEKPVYVTPIKHEDGYLICPKCGSMELEND